MPKKDWNSRLFARRPAPPPDERSGSPTFVAPKEPRSKESWWTTADRDGFTAKAWDRRKPPEEHRLPPAGKRE